MEGRAGIHHSAGCGGGGCGGGGGGSGGSDDDDDEEDDAVVDDLSPVDSIGQFWPLSPGLSGKGEYLASSCDGWQMVPWLDNVDIFVAIAITE